MQVTEILNRYAGKEDIRKVYQNKLGNKTSCCLPKVQWRAVEKYCRKHMITTAWFMMTLDSVLGEGVNFSSALRYLAIYIMEHPEDEIEFLVNQQLS